MKFSEYILIEELTQKQKNKVDSWGPMSASTKIQHQKVFGDSDRVIVPYEKDPSDVISTANFERKVNKVSNASSVISFLRRSGHHTDDYEGGLAYHFEKPERKMKIGKILEKEVQKDTSYASRFKKLYENDPVRAAGKTLKKQIVFSKNKYDVAGMSTGRSGWTSCMNMEDGCNRQHLGDDIHHGTITAYVTNPGDDEIKEPIGRVNLKKFTHVSTGHAIFRPEASSYGTIPEGSKKVISDWAEKHYPSEPGIYVKHPDLYNDDGNTIKVEKPTENQNHKNFHRDVEHLAQKTLDASNEKMSRDYDKHGYSDEDPIGEAHATVEKLSEHTSAAGQVHMMVHGLAHMEAAHDEIDSSEADGSIIMNRWAQNEVARTPNYTRSKIAKVPVDEAFEHHKTLENSGANLNDPAENQSHSKLHARIIDHIMTHGSPEQKDSVLHSVFTEPKTRDYYHEMYTNHNLPELTELDNKHPIEHTKNPRTIHSLLQHAENLDHFGELPTKHIGKHTDSKLLKELTTGDLSNHLNGDEEPNFQFHVGLSENPKSEELQHEVLQNMNLHGGENEGQRSFMNTKPFKAKGDWIEPSSGEDLRAHFANMAMTTPHKSVLGVLQNREDFKDDDLIQSHAKKNFTAR